jgi:hypothetical protein
MPKGPPGHHDQFTLSDFVLQPHHCRGDCSCAIAGCTQHWQWHGAPPPRHDIDKEMHLFSAYRGKLSGPTKQQRFLANYEDIGQWVTPINGSTIFCNWDDKMVAGIFDKVKYVFGGSTVTASKALYFFVPDLFVILDRTRVWDKWKSECGPSILPRDINSLNGTGYVGLMHHVRAKILSAITGGKSFTLANSRPLNVKSIDDLRLVTPLQLSIPKVTGHTLGKAIDNIIR